MSHFVFDRESTMMFRILAAASLMVLVAGCATPPPDTQVSQKTAQQCEVTYRLGSNIPVRDCGPKVTEEERQATVEEWRNAVKAPNTPKGSGG